MTSLLELKEKIKSIYIKAEFIVVPLMKFLLALIVLNTLNGKIGYMSQLDNIALVLIISLMCSFLSTGILVFFAAVISLAHMYTLSMEVALIGLCVYLLMFLLYFRFSPKHSVVVALTPVFFAMKVPYVVPVAVGLICGPAAAVSVGCGVIIHYFTEVVVANASNIKTMDDVVAKVRLIIESFLGERAMLLMIIAFAVTVLVVYIIRRLPVDYAWTIAIVAGAMVEVMMLLIGDLLYEVNLSVAGVLLGGLLAILVGKVIEFFRFCVDYKRTEKVQFEDDEYYYYVKAVPKMSVTMSTKTVKTINTQQESGIAQDGVSVRGGSRPGGSVQGTRAGQATRSSQAVRSGQGVRSSQVSRSAQGRVSSGRSVTTERTAPGTQRTTSRGNDYKTGKSVTIGNTSAKSTNNSDGDDYEELF